MGKQKAKKQIITNHSNNKITTYFNNPSMAKGDVMECVSNQFEGLDKDERKTVKENFLIFIWKTLKLT